MEVIKIKENSDIKRKFSELAPFLFLFFMMLFLHSLTKGLQNDDLWFNAILNDRTILEYWCWRYETWSSRLIVETILIYLSMSKYWIWCLLDSLMFVLLAYSISVLFIPKEKKVYENWIVISMILCYPFIQLSSAGWLATTLNYLWPLSLGMFAFIPLKKAFCHEKVSVISGVLSIICILYAGNTEQMGAILVCVYSIFCVCLLLKKELKLVVVINLVVSLLSILFVITCPGNEVRAMAEMHWFEGYENLGIISKLKYGFFSSTAHFIESSNLMFSLFSILLLVAVWVNYQDKIHRVIGALPLLLKSSILIGSRVLLAYHPEIGIYHPEQELSQITALSSSVSLFYIFINIVMIVLIIICLFFIFGKSKKAYLSILILAAGLVSRIIIGFSPTIFASGLRTFIYFYFALLIVNLLVVDNIFKKTTRSVQKIITYIFVYAGIFLSFACSVIEVIRLPIS